MKIYDYQATRQLLSYQGVVREIEKLLLELPSTFIQTPPRLHLPLANEGVLLVMPASDQRIGMTKLVTVHPNNRAEQLPSVQGEVLVFAVETGRRLAMLDGPAVTEIRTAALSVLAAQRLAADPGGDLLIVGCGAQAAAHLEAFSEVLGTKRILVYSRSREKAQHFCQQQADKRRLVQSVERIDQVLSSVSLVVTATTSSTPVLPPGLIPGQFVAAVGSYRSDMRELPAELIHQATIAGGRLVIDTDAALTESGEFSTLSGDFSRVDTLAKVIQSTPTTFIQPDNSTQPCDPLSWKISARERGEKSDNLNLRDRDWAEKNRPMGVVVFKSVGHSLWDLAAVRAIFSGHD